MHFLFLFSAYFGKEMPEEVVFSGNDLLFFCIWIRYLVKWLDKDSKIQSLGLGPDSGPPHLSPSNRKHRWAEYMWVVTNRPHSLQQNNAAGSLQLHMLLWHPLFHTLHPQLCLTPAPSYFSYKKYFLVYPIIDFCINEKHAFCWVLNYINKVSFFCPQLNVTIQLKQRAKHKWLQ